MTEKDRWITKNVDFVREGVSDQKRTALNQQPEKFNKTPVAPVHLSLNSEAKDFSVCTNNISIFHEVF